MQDPCLSVLRDIFGHAGFRGQQGEIVNHLADGHDALVLMPTGGGKSLCYQVPALVRANRLIRPLSVAAATQPDQPVCH